MTKKTKIIALVVFVIFLIVVVFSFTKHQQRQSILGTFEATNSVPLTSYEPKIPELTQIFTDDHSWVSTLSAEKSRTMIATGDVIPARSVNFQTTKFANFRWPFEKTAYLVQDADITFINLETPLLVGCRPTVEGMSFCGDERNIEGLIYAGIDVASLANNHAGNYGGQGVEETAALLQKNNILATGIAGHVIKEIRGLRLAFLGYNDIGTWPGVSNVEENKIHQEIERAKQDADIVIVAYHWGVEYTNQPSERQRELGHLTIDAGADLVIGNHPHWIQPMEIYKGKLITYAHGNYIFDQMWSEKTRLGVIGKYTFYDKTLVDVEYFPLQIDDYGQPHFLEGNSKQKIFAEMFEESRKLVGP